MSICCILRFNPSLHHLSTDLHLSLSLSLSLSPLSISLFLALNTVLRSYSPKETGRKDEEGPRGWLVSWDSAKLHGG